LVQIQPAQPKLGRGSAHKAGPLSASRPNTQNQSKMAENQRWTRGFDPIFWQSL